MKILQINSVCGIKSTGRVCTDVAEMLLKQGDDCKIVYGRDNVPEKFEKYAIKTGNKLELYFHGIISRLFDASGFGSYFSTKKLIKQIKEYNPDIIHLHNIHGYYLNVKVLFDYLKKSNKRIFWSLYDCWSFTGHCAHYDYNGCEKWKSGCNECQYKSEYPKSLTSNSGRNYYNKKKIFTGVPGLEIIAPSLWMKKQVEKSYLSEYKVHVCPNGIDLNNFKFTGADIKKRYGITEKYIALGVSSYWNDMKGLSVFKELADRLKENDVKIILVGNAEEGDIPDSILHIKNTDSINELCEFYSAADVFVNPTMQETQGLTTIEALACGTPVVVFNSGGAAECVDESCGIVVERSNINGVENAIKEIIENKPFSFESCVEKSRQFDKNSCYSKYLEIY